MQFNEKTFKLKIILVEPSGPINVGSIARLCSNFKVDQLRIVTPRCDINSLSAKKMALRGINFINDCVIYETLSEALIDCDMVLATCGRIHNAKGAKPESFKKVKNWLTRFKNIGTLAIIFGREDRGLTNKELLMAQKIFQIETSKNYPSLNLSHSVAIVLYELSKFNNDQNNQTKQSLDLATSRQIEESFIEIEKLLLKIGFTLPHTSSAKISKFQKYILKAQTSSHELNILRGLVSQINWALQNKEKL